MAGNKLSPRQKMIGMMYLVLTALLALNVSKTVLDAFAKINGSLYTTSINFSNKNNEVYAQFENAAKTNPSKAGPWRDKAYSVKESADAIVFDIQRLKYELVAAGDGKVSLSINGQEVIKEKGTTFDQLSKTEKFASFYEVNMKKDRNKSWEIMGYDGGKDQGTPMVQDLTDFKSLLVSYTTNNLSISSSLETTFDFSDVEKKKGEGKDTWLESNFKDMPLIAAVTILSKIQADVRNAEADVINFLKQEIDATSLKFTGAEAIQIAPSNYIFLGDTFKADVFIAAKDSTQNPTIYLGDYELGEDGQYTMVGDYDTIPVNGGKGKYAIKTRAEGYKKWGGLIAMKTDAGTQMYPFNGEYQVAKQSLVVSPTKMNVLYILGDQIGNPVDISVPGVPKDKLIAYCDNGKVVKKGSSWEIFPTKVGKANISVSADIDGERRSMGKMEFRVKRVPSPVADFNAKLKNGKIKKNVLLGNSTKLIAYMEDFDFDLKYKVVGFTLGATYNGFFQPYTTKGARLDDNMKNLIKNLPKGSQIVISNIMAKGPDGRQENLGALAITMN
ncbi:MAG: hypothetical protein CMP75_04285 [Flavobacteriales bacterium]|nr:hypothetical protein [Flavobacteriales bacterium]|tara:strand:+ start:386 stop:2056 length:1671 start_codon:yes stop_codon:yes gene_type:complete